MTIRQVIRFNLKPGTRASFVEGFAPIIARVREEPGCEQYELFLSHDAPDALVMLERWSSQEALDASLKKLKPNKDDPALAFLGFIDGAPLRERYAV